MPARERNVQLPGEGAAHRTLYTNFKWHRSPEITVPLSEAKIGASNRGEEATQTKEKMCNIVGTGESGAQYVNWRIRASNGRADTRQLRLCEKRSP